MAIFLLCFIAHGTSHAGCSSATPDPSLSVFVEGDVLRVKDTVIAGKMADTIEKQLTTGSVRLVIFECILGALASDSKRLMKYFPALTVHVRGGCNSGCARLAFSAKKLILLDSQDPKYPTSLMIHTPYFVFSGRPRTELDLDTLNFYATRFLGAIPVETLSTALTENRKGNYGIIITRDRNDALNVPGIHAYRCKPYPQDCKPIAGSSLERLGISSE